MPPLNLDRPVSPGAYVESATGRRLTVLAAAGAFVSFAYDDDPSNHVNMSRTTFNTPAFRFVPAAGDESTFTSQSGLDLQAGGPSA
jgi:hypothetical protein